MGSAVVWGGYSVAGVYGAVLYVGAETPTLPAPAARFPVVAEGALQSVS